MTKRIGLAIFGLGRAGMIHFRNLVHNYRVVIQYIVEADVEKAKQVVATYHLDTKVMHSDEMEKVVKDPSISAVVVCTPTFEHEKIVRAALENNKAVFCEKPVSQSDIGIKNLYEFADKVKQPLFCSFNRRFDPSFKSLKERCKEKREIGDVHMVKTCSRDSPLPSTDYLRISGGMFHDCAVHDIDMVCWILGEFPVEVFVMAQSHIPDIRDLGDVDTVLISMRFPSKALASIDLSRHAVYGYDQRVEVFGNKGMLVSENQRPTELTAYSKDGTVQDSLKFSFPQRYAEGYVSAMEHFLDVVEGKAKMSVTSTDAYNVSAIATACETSHKTGKPVQLSLN